MPQYSDSGKIEGYVVEEVIVADPEFDVIRAFLKGSYKSDLTLSRAMGREREAVLDRTSNIGKNISKEVNKNNKYGGN